MARQGDWAAVVEACEFGLAAANRLFSLQVGRDHRGLWLEEARGLPALAAYALAKLGKLERAVVTLERGRAVFLSEALGRDHADLDRLAAIGRADLRDRYQQAADRLADLERVGQQTGRAQTGSASRGERARATRQARAELDQAVTAIQMVKGYENFLASPTYHEVISASVDSPLAYIAVTEVGGIALVVDGRYEDTTAPTLIWLDELTETTLRTSLSTEYLDAYERQLDQDHRERWLETLESVTRSLWDIVMAPILAVAPIDRLTLVPGDLLGLLPLHAAWREDPSRAIGRRYALDEALITYAPSARALLFAQRAADQSISDKILMVYDSTLEGSELEIQAISPWFRCVKQLRRKDVTLEMVRSALPEYPVLHFSCHGSANPRDPLASSLAVANDGNLTLRDLFEQRLPGARPAVLSACETALVAGDIPEEAVGLPSGLLQAGAAGALGSLWPVADTATGALMMRFYELWRRNGLEPAQALRRAQQWIRDACIAAEEIHFSEVISAGNDTHIHPTHWAAFTYTGI